MEKLLCTLMFYFAILLALGMFAVFLICMYLREFPRYKHISEADLSKNIYKNQIEVDKSKNNKTIKKKELSDK